MWKIRVKCDLWPGQVSLGASGDDRLSDSNNNSIETVAVRSNQDESVDHVPASCSGYIKVMNFDNLYSSLKKIKNKSVSKTLRLATL